MKKVYPVILSQDGDGYFVSVPDFSADTQGEDMADAIAMARDLIGLMGTDLLDQGKSLPEPRKVRDRLLSGIVSYVDIDFSEYRRKLNNRSVRKNCTIPGWLADRADSLNLNYSHILQEALMHDLNCSAELLFDSAVSSAQKGDYQSCCNYLDQLTHSLFINNADDPVMPELVRQYFRQSLCVLFDCFLLAETGLQRDLWNRLDLGVCYSFFVHVAPLKFKATVFDNVKDDLAVAEKTFSVDQLYSLSAWGECCNYTIWEKHNELDIISLIMNYFMTLGNDNSPFLPARCVGFYQMVDSERLAQKMLVSVQAIITMKLGGLVPTSVKTKSVCRLGGVDLESLVLWRFVASLYSSCDDISIRTLSFDEMVAIDFFDGFVEKYFSRVFLSAYMIDDDSAE